MIDKGAVAPSEVASLSRDAIAASMAAGPAEPELDANQGDRIVSIIGPHPAHFCAGGPSYRLQKAYRYLSRRHHPTHERGTWPAGEAMGDGEWDEVGPTFISEHSVRECGLGELSDWVELLNLLATRDDAALITGRRKEGGGEHYFGRWLIPSKEQVHYADTPSRWFVVDVDDLAGEPEDADSAVKEFIAEYLPEFEGAGMVVAFTGSAGIKGTRVRLIFELEEARTLAAQLAFVDSVNARTGDAILDRSIYKPGHLVLTANPHLVAPVENGGGVRWTRVPRPLPALRVWHVPGDRAAIPDVDCAIAAPAASGGVPLSLGATKKEVADVLAAMGPGNYDPPIHWYVSHLAYKTPPSLKEATLDAAIAELRARMIATSDAAGLHKRLAGHLKRERLSRKWDRALAARERDQRPLIGTPEAPVFAGPVLQSLLHPRSRDVVSVRRQLCIDTGRAKAELLAGAQKHVLIPPTPGVGKTRALLESITPGSLVSNLVRVLAPDHRLAGQSWADAKAHAASLTSDGTYHGFELASLVRHHKGRSQDGMCTDAVFGPKAKRAEQLGISPKAHVCQSCPTGLSGACKWLNQAKDTGPGVIFEAHANILHRDAAHDNTDLYVFDEGVLGTILADRKSGAAAKQHTRLLDLLTVDIRKRSRKGEKEAIERSYVTKRLRGIRRQLVDALASCVVGVERGVPTRPPTGCFAWLFAPTEYKEFERGSLVDKSGDLLDAACSLERQQQESLRERIVRADDAGEPIGELIKQLHISLDATKILEAIRASRHHRDEVFALTVYTKGKARDAYVWAQSRFTGLDALLRGRSMSLDGTAVPDVWRAMLSPDGTAISEEIIRAEPEAPAGGTHTTVYHGCSGATSLFTGLEESAEEEDSAELEELEAAASTARAAPWLRIALEPDAYAKVLGDTEAKVKEKRSQRERRKQRSDSHLDQLWKFVVCEALNAKRSVLIEGRSTSVLLITTKRVKLRLLALGLPPNVAVEHFGAIRGLNAYSQVPIAIVVGRNRPSNIALEMATEALLMHNPAVKTIARFRPDPKQERVWMEVHPDPLVKQVQDVITLGEVRQAVARIRAFDRTPDSACQVHLIGGYDPGLKIDADAHWRDTMRDVSEVALAAGALFARPASNQTVFPELFAKRDGGSAYLAGRLAWAHHLQQLASEKRSYPNKKIGEGETDFPISDKNAFRASGDYKLVKVKREAAKADGIRGAYGEYAIIRATWGKSRLERLMGAKLVAFREARPEELERELENARLRAFDGR